MLSSGAATPTSATTTAARSASGTLVLGLLLAGNAGSRRLNLENTPVKLLALQLTQGLLSIRLGAKGDKAIAQGPGTTEDNLALGPNPND